MDILSTLRLLRDRPSFRQMQLIFVSAFFLTSDAFIV